MTDSTQSTPAATPVLDAERLAQIERAALDLVTTMHGLTGRPARLAAASLLERLAGEAPPPPRVTRSSVLALSAFLGALQADAERLAVRVAPVLCNDDIDTAHYGLPIGATLTAGGVEAYLPIDPDGRPDILLEGELLDLAAVRRALPALLALFADPRIAAALEAPRSEARAA